MYLMHNFTLSKETLAQSFAFVHVPDYFLGDEKNELITDEQNKKINNYIHTIATDLEGNYHEK